MSTPVGIAHLTLLRLSPPELVTTAAAAGYDFVGVRVKAVTAGEHQYPMAPGSPMSRETLRRLDDTGLRVRDIEFLTLRPDTGPDDWRPALEAGAALGASTFSVVGVDLSAPMLARASEAFMVGFRAAAILSIIGMLLCIVITLTTLRDARTGDAH